MSEKAVKNKQDVNVRMTLGLGWCQSYSKDSCLYLFYIQVLQMPQFPALAPEGLRVTPGAVSTSSTQTLFSNTYSPVNGTSTPWRNVWFQNWDWGNKDEPGELLGSESKIVLKRE